MLRYDSFRTIRKQKSLTAAMNHMRIDSVIKLREDFMKNCITVMIAVLLLLALPLAVFAGGQGEQGEQDEQGEQAAEKDPIKLGGVWPLADITGDQGSKAAQLAVEEINANGGVLGRQLELLVID